MINLSERRENSFLDFEQLCVDLGHSLSFYCVTLNQFVFLFIVDGHLSSFFFFFWLLYAMLMPILLCMFPCTKGINIGIPVYR